MRSFCVIGTVRQIVGHQRGRNQTGAPDSFPIHANIKVTHIFGAKDDQDAKEKATKIVDKLIDNPELHEIVSGELRSLGKFEVKRVPEWV